MKELSNTVPYSEIHACCVMKSTCTACSAAAPFKDLLVLSCECALCKACAKKEINSGTYFTKNMGNGSYSVLECQKHKKALNISELKGFMKLDVMKSSVAALKSVLKCCKCITLTIRQEAKLIRN